MQIWGLGALLQSHIILKAWDRRTATDSADPSRGPVGPDGPYIPVEGLTAYFDDPAFERLASVVDPYTYRDRLSMPKMVISSTGDEFFSPDDSYAWFDGMKGKTYLREFAVQLV